MKITLPPYTIALTGYALHIASLVVSPLIAGKYFIIAGLPASCSVLAAPIPLFATCYFARKYGFLYVRSMAWSSLIACLIAAAIFWVINQIPISPHGVVSAGVWNEVLGAAPKVIICWGLVCGLAQWAVTCIDMKKVYYYPILAATLRVLWGGMVACSAIGLLCIGMRGSLSMSVAKLLVGSFCWFAIFTLCIASLLWILKSVVEERALRNNTGQKSTRQLLQGIYKWLLMLFWLMLLLTNVVVVKWFNVGRYFFTIGVLTYPFTFVFTDLIAELYGKQKAKYAVWTGFIASSGMLAVVLLAGLLPMHKASPVSQQAFLGVFGFTPGIVLASMVAYFVAQFADIYLFDALRIRTQGRHLWLRNNVATMVSQLLDTVVFSLFAWIIWPKLDPSAGSVQVVSACWYRLTVNEYVGKVVLALLDTPWVYGAVKLIKRFAS